VIVTGSVPGTRAVQQQTPVIPIVFQAVGDPIASGIVKSIARPEGNATGITNMLPSIAGKWVELLKDAASQIKRVGLLYNAQASFTGYFPSMEEAASALAVQAIRIPYRDAVEMVRGVDMFAVEPNGATVVVPPSPSIEGRKIIYSLTVSHRLSTMYVERFYVVEGGLMSYAASNLDTARRSAYFVDRILRGAKVSEMPVELPTKFELAINVKTAKSMGLTIPESFLLRADEASYKAAGVHCGAWCGGLAADGAGAAAGGACRGHPRRSRYARPRVLAAFRSGLGETGYVEDQNVAVEYHWLERQLDRLPALVADLVRRRLAVTVAFASIEATLAAKAATTTIPIVFVVGGSPVRLGLVASLAQPGGNLTGMSSLLTEAAPKRLGLLHELVPKANRVVVLVLQSHKTGI
jgi:putative tryptophan/tyrosine transport system substrate-binding protein